jgi:hypothetical protein
MQLTYLGSRDYHILDIYLTLMNSDLATIPSVYLFLLTAYNILDAAYKIVPT